LWVSECPRGLRCHSSDGRNGGGSHPPHLRAVRGWDRNADYRPPAERRARRTASRSGLGAERHSGDALPSALPWRGRLEPQPEDRQGRDEEAAAAGRVRVDHLACSRAAYRRDDLWQRVKERLERSAGLYARQLNGKLLSRPRLKDESAYLLTDFTRCSVCSGPIGTDLRGHGSRNNRQHIPNYACLDHKRRGAAICTNRVGIPQEALDRAILNAVCDVLDEGVLDRAVDLAFADLTAGVTEQRARHAELDGELSAIQTRIDRLLDALADGSVPRDEVAARLNAEKTRKDALTNERARLSGMLIVADLDTEKIK